MFRYTVIVVVLISSVAEGLSLSGSPSETANNSDDGLFDHLADFVKVRYALDTECHQMGLESMGGLFGRRDALCRILAQQETCLKDVLKRYPDMPTDYFAHSVEIARALTMSANEKVGVASCTDSDAELGLDSTPEGYSCTFHEMSLTGLTLQACFKKRIADAQWTNLHAEKQREETECQEAEGFIVECLEGHLLDCYPSNSNKFLGEVLYESQYFHYRLSQKLHDQSGHKKAGEAKNAEEAADFWTNCKNKGLFTKDFAHNFTGFLARHVEGKKRHNNVILWAKNLDEFSTTFGRVDEEALKKYHSAETTTEEMVNHDDNKMNSRELKSDDKDGNGLLIARNVLLVVGSLVIVAAIAFAVCRIRRNGCPVKAALVGDDDVPYNQEGLQMGENEHAL